MMLKTVRGRGLTALRLHKVTMMEKERIGLESGDWHALNRASYDVTPKLIASLTEKYTANPYARAQLALFDPNQDIFSERMKLLNTASLENPAGKNGAKKELITKIQERFPELEHVSPESLMMLIYYNVI